MHAIVSLLDEPHFRRIETLWQELEFDCGLAGINKTPLPHFSFHVAAEYDFDRLNDILVSLAKSSQTFMIRTTGLGLFTGDIPVLYIPITKDNALEEFHRNVWEEVNAVAAGASPFYAPNSWVPHISLARGDVDRENLGCAMERLAFERFDWEIEINHLALVNQYSGQVGKVQGRFPFKPGPDGG
jgi:2'-5' RNA ligase